MSDLTGNPHYKSTLESISDFGEYTIGVEGLTDATIIWQGLVDQAQATLALAFEQRTANLIALWASPGNLPDGSYDKGMEMSGVHYGELATQIKARLGLGETNA